MDLIKRFSLVVLLMLVGCASEPESVSVDDANAATKERVDEPAADAGPVMTLELPK